MDIFYHWDPIRGAGRGGVCLLGTLRYIDGGLWTHSSSLYGSSVMGTWRTGSFTGDPEVYVKEGSGNGYLSP